MVSFQRKLAKGLIARGIDISYDLSDTPYAAVLVIGGTRQLGGLTRARRRGVPIVQRLDGMNWLHKVSHAPERRIQWRAYLRSEYRNWLLSLIRSRLANRIVYQSQFVRQWWESKFGIPSVPSTVIYNAVDLQVYSPQGAERPPEDHCRLLLVEGSLAGGYELGLEFAIELSRRLATLELPFPDHAIELKIVGKVPPQIRQRWEGDERTRENAGRLRLDWAGVVPESQIPAIDRSAHLMFAADINSACPNSVIEALACGLPVAAFDSGAISELVTPGAGRVVQYGGDPWKLETPDFASLANAAGTILQERDSFSRGARLRAEQAFALESMLDAYIEVLLES